MPSVGHAALQEPFQGLSKTSVVVEFGAFIFFFLNYLVHVLHVNHGHAYSYRRYLNTNK